MRAYNLGTIQYEVGDLPGTSTLENVITYLQDRELRIARAFHALALGHIDMVSIAPAKPRAGDIRYPDGIGWNPGGGAGIYYYDGSMWNQLG